MTCLINTSCFRYIALVGLVLYFFLLSYDVASGSKITLCDKNDKPLLVLQVFGKLYDVQINVAYIMTK